MEYTESPYLDQDLESTVNFSLESAPKLGIVGCFRLHG